MKLLRLLIILQFFGGIYLAQAQHDHGGGLAPEQGISANTSTRHIVRNQGFTFTPNDITVSVGDTVTFSIGGSHDVVQVTMAEWESNGNTPISNGFSTPFGGGNVVFNTIGTFYYVCTPHASLSMKGIVRVVPVSKPQVPTVEVKNQGLTYVPNDISVNPGDTVKFTLDRSHNVEEVNQATWDANGTTPLANGFTLPFGGGKLVLTKPGIYYYVCTPHASFGMKGIIRVNGNAAEETPDYVAILSGAQEVPRVVSNASGSILATLRGDTLRISGSFSGLSTAFNPNVAGGSHIHTGYAGQNGGITLTLVPTLDANNLGGKLEMAKNTFVLTASQKESLLTRKFYVNIHTAGTPSGEIRGQVLPVADAYYMVNLTGAYEVPSLVSKGLGGLALELKKDTLIVSGAFAGLNGDFDAAIGGGAHLHVGLAGETGRVEIPITAGLNADLRSGVFEAAKNKIALTGAQIALLKGTSLYANIHTKFSAPGEIRGQVGRVAKVRFRTDLLGINEVPAIMSGATGQAYAELLNDTLYLSGSFTGLESDFNPNVAGGAHIHLNITGRNGAIIFPLIIELAANKRAGKILPEKNKFKLTEAQIVDLLDRKMYVNIHTLNRPGGEIRGQLLPENQFTFNALLSGTQEVPSVLTNALGGAKAEIIGNTLTVTGSFNGLGSKFNPSVAGGAHIHAQYAGSNGPIIIRLAANPSTDSLSGTFEAVKNKFTLREGLKDSLISRRLYVNIHTRNFRGGEVRGQLLQDANLYLFAPLSGTSETVPVNSEGSGMAIIEVQGNKALVSGSFGKLKSKFNARIGGGAHIHFGLAGTNGGIVKPLKATVPADSLSGVFQVSENTISWSSGKSDTLKSRAYYVNVHTTETPSGEIRGNFLAPATAYFTSTLLGFNEIPAVSTTASGGLKFELTANNLIMTGSFNGLQGQFDSTVAGGSHIHLGSAGQNGPIAFATKPVLSANKQAGIFSVANNTFTLSDDQKASLLQGALYHNIHTSVFKSGEIRGQVLQEVNFFPGNQSLIKNPPAGARIVVQGDSKAEFIPAWASAKDVNRNKLAYTWQLSPVPNFALVLVNASTGTDSSLVLRLGQVDTLLATAGLKIGDSVTVYHRAIASDGSVFTPAAGATVRLVRGVVTALDPAILQNFAIQAYPSPVSKELKLRVQSPVNVLTIVKLRDLSGRIISEKMFGIVSGENETVLELTNVNPGLYFVEIIAGNQRITTLKVLKN